MDTCERLQQAGAYYDGELPGGEQRSFEAHLAQCPVCTQELNQLKTLSQLLARVRVPEIPATMLDRLHETPRVRERVLVRMAEVLMAAAAVILVACASWIFATLGQGTAVATTAAPWEQAAVTLNEKTSPSETQFTQWVVENLSPENAHE